MVAIFQWALIAVLAGTLIMSLWRRSVHLQYWEVHRESDPGTYWLVVAVQAGVAGFVLYRVLAG